MNRISLFLGASLLAANLLADAEDPVPVYVLVGQSNMEGHARIETLEHLGMNPETEPVLREIVGENGEPKVFEDISISYLSRDGIKEGPLTVGYGATDEKIGPELAFGIYTRKRVGRPILLIKAAWGGKSLHTDFRPPGAGPYSFSEEQLGKFAAQGKDVARIRAEKEAASGNYYRQTIEHVRDVLADPGRVIPDYDPAQGCELAGFVWFQGWNDMVDRGTYPDRDQPGGYDAYSEVLAQFIRDVRRDLVAPELPFVIGVLGVGGPIADYLPAQKRYRGIHRNFRDAMAGPASLAEFEGSVAAFRTETCWDRELHLLRHRQRQLEQAWKKRVEEKQLEAAAARSLREEMRETEFSEREKEVLEKGVSNAEYHYLGSARILTAIGKGFADTLAELASP